MSMTTTIPNRPLYGAMMIIIGMLAIGIIDNCVRLIADHVGLWQFHGIRSLMAAPLIVIGCLLLNLRWLPISWRGALIRTTFLTLSMLLYFGALPTASVAQAGAGLFTSPIWVLVISALFLNAPIGPRRIIAVGLGFIGVLLILKPWQDTFTIWSLAPVAAGFLYALGALSTRRYCAEEPAPALMFLFFVGLGVTGWLGVAALSIWPQPGLVPEAPFFFLEWRWPIVLSGWGWIAFQAAGSIFCVFCVTKGYQSGDTTYIALFDYTFLLSASLTGWLAWGDVLDAYGFAGAALIIGSGVFIALRTAQEPT